jgi:hypothetical protein
MSGTIDDPIEMEVGKPESLSYASATTKGSLLVVIGNCFPKFAGARATPGSDVCIAQESDWISACYRFPGNSGGCARSGHK